MTLRYLRKSLDKIEESSNLVGDRVYNNATLIIPGIYQDSASRLKIFYKADILKKNVSNWKSNFLNIDHSPSILSRIGFVESPKWKNNALVADLRIIPATNNARDAINLIDQGLANFLSIEALTEEFYDEKLCCLCLSDIQFLGAAIVTTPAVINAKIKNSGEKLSA